MHSGVISHTQHSCSVSRKRCCTKIWLHKCWDRAVPGFKLAVELGDHIVELVETVLELVRFQPTAITTGSVQRAVDAIQKPPS